MNFQSICQDFQSASNGTDAFKQLQHQCESAILIPQNIQQCSALFLIYGFVKNYVLFYEDQAVSSEFSHQAKQQLMSYMLELNQALMTQDESTILERLNHIIKVYSQSTQVF